MVGASAHVLHLANTILLVILELALEEGRVLVGVLPRTFSDLDR